MADIIIYNTADGKAEIKLYADNGTVWLTQAQIVDLFNSSKSSISEHIKNIFSEDELDENSVVRKIRTTAADGKIILFHTIVLMSFLPLVSAFAPHVAHSSASGQTIH